MPARAAASSVSVAAATMEPMVRSAAAAPFVARREQLERFRSALALAAAGEPGAILLSGDAGVGKTRLLGEMAESATAGGARVVVSHCIDLGDVGLPYLPFTEALTQLRPLGDRVEDVITARPALGRLLDNGTAEPPAGTEEQVARLQLFDGIAAVLGAAGTSQRPLVLIIEDLHWADPSSRDVLRFLLARLRAEHLLIVGTYRTDDLHRRHPLRPLLAELLRHPKVDHLQLPPFTRDELAEFAVAVTGAPLPEADLHRVLARSEGNAYFAEALLECGADPVALPGSLADVLHARVEQLDPIVQHLARIASVAGRRVAEPLLWAVAAQDPAFTDSSTFDAALRESVAHNVLASENAEWIAFRHALLAEAVYTDLLPSEQSSLHRAYLRALGADSSLGSHAELAHHALKSHDLPAALSASHAAAREAAEVLAPAEELRRLETVLELWDAVPDAEQSVGQDRVAVTMAAASAASRAGQPGRAAALARAALTRGDPLRAARLTPAAASYLIDDDHAEEALERASAALVVLDAEEPSVDRARVLAAQARSALNSDLDDIARQSAERAVAESRALGVPDAEADALTTLAVLEVDEPDTAAGLLASALAGAQGSGDLLAELRSAHNLTSNLYYAGRLDQARKVCDDGVERARTTGVIWMGYGVSLLLLRELTRYVTGDLSPAPPTRDDVPPLAMATLQVVDLYASVARGDPDAVDRGRAVKADWQKDPWNALLSGGCTIDGLIWAGERDEAVELTLQLIDFLGRTWNDYFLGGIWLSALGIAALADRAEQTRLTGGDPAADIELGESLTTRAVQTAQRGRPRGGRLGPEGRAWLARAHAEHARLVGADDPQLWREAIREFGYGHRYELARSRWRLAAALAAAGDRTAAHDEAAAALAEAQQLGAAPLTEAIRQLGRRARLDLPGSRPAVGVLTDREEEVLRLVARGLTNRQVGEQLYISGKTVSVHMSNVLGKLGASGRAEAVSVAHQRGLLEVDRAG